MSAAAIIDLIPVTASVEELSAQEDEVEEPIVVTTPNNAQVGQPLKWFRAQPPNSKLRMKQRINIDFACLTYTSHMSIRRVKLISRGLSRC